MSTIADLLIKLGGDVSGYESAMDAVPDAAVDATDRVEGAFERLGPSLATAGKVAGVAAGAALVAGAVIGIEQEAVSDKLAAQLDLTGAEAERAGDVAGSLYAQNFGDSFEQVNEAVGAVLGTLGRNLDDAALEGLTGKALALADVFDLDVTEAVTRAGTLMKTGLAADAEEAFDLVTASMQQIAPGLRDELGDATSEYSQFFSNLGLSGEEMLALFAQADDAISLDKSGDAIKEFGIRATDMSTASTAAFETLGMDAAGMADRLLAGGDTARGAFDQIVDGLLGIEDPTAQANTAIALFGTPLEDLGTAEIPKFLDSLDSMGTGLEDVAGSADRMAETASSNAANKIGIFQRRIEMTLAKVVEAPGILGDAAAGIAGFGQAISPVAPMLAGLGFIFQDQLGKMASSAASTTASVVASVARQVAAWALLGVQALLHAAKVAAAWLIALGPIAIVIAAVVAVVVLIIRHWDRVKQVTRAAWAAVVGAVVSAWESVKGAVTSAISTVLGWLRALPGRFVGALGGLASTVVAFLTRWHPVAVLIRVGADRLPQLLAWVRGLPGQFVSALGSLGGKLYDLGLGAMNSMWNGLKSLVPSILGWVGDLASDIAGKLDPRNWFSTPEEHYRMLFGEAFRAIADEGRGALGMLERAAARVAEASVPPALATPGIAAEPAFAGVGPGHGRLPIIHVRAEVDKRVLFDVYQEADAEHDQFNGAEG